MTIVDDIPTQHVPVTTVVEPEPRSDLDGVRTPAALSPPAHRPAGSVVDADGDPGRALRVIRVLALGITGLVGLSAALLSFASLADLAARAGYPAELSYLWPGIVDGTILLATMAIVVLGPHGELQSANRRFFWLVLGTAAVVSVGGNVVHALLPHGAPLPVWLAIPIAAVAPLSLLADVHGATILGRLRTPNLMQARQIPADRGAERSPVHDALALLVKERNLEVKAIADLTVAEISLILARLDADESQRSILREHPQLKHHRNLRVIIETATEIRERIEPGAVVDTAAE
ncbi:MAG: DUF2637 domain-containing protein [Mycolicibacterium sp.]|uniref:DUF2637 domain-containing protein n=1 Tax=Mycolicibacterium sp. TaxID=2320850 RepID=UPI003D0FF7FE